MTYESTLLRSALDQATVISTEADGSIRLGLSSGATADAETLDGRSFEIGDRVLIAETVAGLVAVGRVGKAASAEIEADGVTARTEPGAGGGMTLRVTDRAGNTLLCHDADSGVTTLTVHQDNRLRLSTSRTLDLFGAEGVRIASPGPVVIESGVLARMRSGSASVMLSAAGLILEGASTALRSRSLEIEALSTRLRSKTATASGERADVRFERTDAECQTLHLKAKRVFRSISGLCQTLAGRARMVVSDSWQVDSKRTRLVSQQDTSIDGEHIHLG